VTTLPRTRDQFDVQYLSCSIRQTFGYCQGRWNSPQGLRGCLCWCWASQSYGSVSSLLQHRKVLVQGCSLDGHLMPFRGVQICFSRHESLLQYFHEEQLLNLWVRLGYLCCVVPSTVHDDPRSRRQLWCLGIPHVHHVLVYMFVLNVDCTPKSITSRLEVEVYC